MRATFDGRERPLGDVTTMHPVLLVHGINDTGARFDKMRSVLQARGFGPVHAMNITPPDASITLEVMGEQVMDAVRLFKETAEAQKVDIVAFSMGALAVRTWGSWRPDGRLRHSCTRRPAPSPPALGRHRRRWERRR